MSLRPRGRAGVPPVSVPCLSSLLPVSIPMGHIHRAGAHDAGPEASAPEQSLWGRWSESPEAQPRAGTPRRPGCTPSALPERGSCPSVSRDLASKQRGLGSPSPPGPGLGTSLCPTLQGLPGTPGPPQPLGPAPRPPSSSLLHLALWVSPCLAFSLSVPPEPPALRERGFTPAASPAA